MQCCGATSGKYLSNTFLCRRIFANELDAAELPAHVYLQSIHNISIERSWLRLRLDFGDNAVVFFQRGRDEGIYNAFDPQQQ